MKKKLIVILVDGLSANYVRDHAWNVPNILALGAGGTIVERLGSAVPGTSMPGRSCMMTGLLAHEHGVYGNHLLKGRAFIPADAADLKSPTIATYARSAGLDVAAIGAGMIRTEDAGIFVPPAWLRRFLDKSKFAREISVDRLARARLVQDPDGRLAALGLSNPYSYPVETLTIRDIPPALTGLVADQLIMRAATSLACSDAPPDLILTEILMTDSIQHSFGYGSEAAHCAIAAADALIGSLVNQLRNSGRLADYSLAVASDHGHSEIRTAIFPEAIVPGMLW